MAPMVFVWVILAVEPIKDLQHMQPVGFVAITNDTKALEELMSLKLSTSIEVDI